MAFRRTLTPTFTAPVVVQTPNEKGGFDKNTFDVVYQRTSIKENEDLKSLSNHDLLKRVVVNWKMIDAEDNEPVPFSPEELEAVMEVPGAAFQMAQVFWSSQVGVREKNS